MTRRLPIISSGLAEPPGDAPLIEEYRSPGIPDLGALVGTRVPIPNEAASTAEMSPTGDIANELN